MKFINFVLLMSISFLLLVYQRTAQCKNNITLWLLVSNNKNLLSDNYLCWHLIIIIVLEYSEFMRRLLSNVLFALKIILKAIYLSRAEDFKIMNITWCCCWWCEHIKKYTKPFYRAVIVLIFGNLFILIRRRWWCDILGLSYFLWLDYISHRTLILRN